MSGSSSAITTSFANNSLSSRLDSCLSSPESSSGGLLAVHAVLAYAQLCLMKTLELSAVDVIARLIAETTEGGALGHLR